MKASFYTESVLYWLARGVSFAAQRVPPTWNTAFGSAVGTLFYHALSRRKVALVNLRAAFGDAYSPEEYRQILKAQFQHLGMTLMEVSRIPAMDRSYVDQWITVAPESRERLEAALSKGHGVIFLTAHFGDWELVSITGALHGYPTLVLAREQGWPKLNRLLTQYRESKGCRIITKGFPIREMIRGLEQGKIVGILADQDGGRNGVLAPFFGRLASTAPGTIALSLNTRAPILPVFMVRRDGPAHTLIVEEPLVIPEGGSLEEQVQKGIAAYLRVLEGYIRRYPSQWLWFHRRWKSCPQRRILIFSDGKAGHLAQAKALAQRIEKAWEIRSRDDKRLRGMRASLLQVKTTHVQFRHPLGRLLVSMIAGLAPRKFRAGDFWLRLCLTDASYRAIRSAHADISISCGAATAGVNLLWAGGIGSKTVHITRSVFPSWRRFDLAVIPRHDRPPEQPAKNLLVIDGALAPDQPLDTEQARLWREHLQLKKPRQIGLLLGGPTRGVEFEAGQIEETVQGLLSAAESLDAELLVTSSRRTPAAVEELLDRMLGKNPRCRLLVLVNRRAAGIFKETAEAIPCILSLSHLLVVSGDSISMVSEAVARRKPVVSFLPNTTGRSHGGKYRRFLEGLDSKGSVRLAEAEKVGEAVLQILDHGSRTAPGIEQIPVAASADPVEEFLVQWL